MRPEFQQEIRMKQKTWEARVQTEGRSQEPTFWKCSEDETKENPAGYKEAMLDNKYNKRTLHNLQILSYV